MTGGAVVVGDRIPEIRRTVTQADIDAYAEVSGDRNPLHVDPEFARTTPYGGTIAHGLLTLAFVSQAMEAWDPDGWVRGGELRAKFVGPVRPGDTVAVTGEVTAVVDDGDARWAEVDVRCSVGDRVVIAATARRRLRPG